jgi:biopolymer transport protein ExbD
MSWKVRPDGAAAVVEVPSLEEVMEGVEEGRFAPSDEVQGPDETAWVPLDAHPAFAEAVALEPAQAGAGDETHLDMTPLIDVCLVLLVIFIMLIIVGKLAQRLEAPTPARGKVGPVAISREQAKQTMVHAVVRRENGQTVYRIEDKPTPPEALESELYAFTKPTSGGRKLLLLEADDDVPLGDVVRLEDAAYGAKFERILYLTNPEEK